MKFFPLYADLRGRLCLLIGQGPKADEKEKLLQSAGACVRRRPAFDPADAEGVMLIVADVDNDEAEVIRAFADSRHIFVNVVDKPRYCTFIFPAIIQRGDLIVSISTSGSCPGLAAWLRRKMEPEFGDGFESALEVLAETRQHVKQVLEAYDDRKEFYSALFSHGFLETAWQGEQALRDHLGRYLDDFRSREEFRA